MPSPSAATASKAMAVFPPSPGLNRQPINGALLLSYLKTKRVVALFFAILLIALVLNVRTASTAHNISTFIPARLATPFTKQPDSLETHDTTAFWPQFYAALIAATPRCALPHDVPPADSPRHRPFSGPLQRQDTLHLHQRDEQELKDSHAWFVEHISDPAFPRPHFTPGSAGIVTSAGGGLFAQALVALRMLRRTGSTLPVEVYLTRRDEDEGNICSEIMPILGAECRILSELLDTAVGTLPRRLDVAHFQVKVFAMMLSEFDNILWLDADAFPLIDPRPLLESELLAETGLITWPDYWAETTGPLYWRVIGVPEDRWVKSGTRAASEAAQLLVSKSVALRRLELATYYNFHGPDMWYVIISQGAYGGGDKDTFLAAAQALGEPFYDVKTGVQTFGIDDGDRWLTKAMLAAHPLIDQERYGDGSNHGGFDFGEPDDKFSDAYFERVPAVIAHAQMNKPNVAQLLHQFEADEIAPQRWWGPVERIVRAFGHDVERAYWEALMWTACAPELKGHQLSAFRDHAHEDICGGFRELYDVVFEGKVWNGTVTKGSAKEKGGDGHDADAAAHSPEDEAEFDLDMIKDLLDNKHKTDHDGTDDDESYEDDYYDDDAQSKEASAP